MGYEQLEDSPLNGLSPDERPPVPPPTEHLPPNTILLIGKITEILVPGNFGFSGGRCGNEPCFAEIEIETVIQTGMGLTSHLSNSQKITIHFPNTLNGHEIGKNQFQALSEKDRFKGLIQHTESNESSSENGTIYTVLRYEKM